MPPFTNEMLTKIFAAPPARAVYARTGDGASYVVAKVTAVQHPPPFVVQGAGLKRFAAQVGSQAGQDVGSAVASAAREKQGVKINRQTVDRLTGESS